MLELIAMRVNQKDVRKTGSSVEVFSVNKGAQECFLKRVLRIFLVSCDSIERLPKPSAPFSP